MLPLEWQWNQPAILFCTWTSSETPLAKAEMSASRQLTSGKRAKSFWGSMVCWLSSLLL